MARSGNETYESITPQLFARWFAYGAIAMSVAAADYHHCQTQLNRVKPAGFQRLPVCSGLQHSSDEGDGGWSLCEGCENMLCCRSRGVSNKWTIETQTVTKPPYRLRCDCEWHGKQVATVLRRLEVQKQIA